MNFYENHILPRIIDHICGHRAFSEQRAKVVPEARGRVLEVGYGSGTNLPWYDSARVDELVALDPASGAFSLAAKREAEMSFPIEHVPLRGEEIPLDDRSVDTIVVAYTLCTIPDVERALGEMRRVLKPDGQLLFAEHGLAPTLSRQRWQQRFARPWAAAFGGCQLTRNPPELLARTGFKVEQSSGVDLDRPPPIPGVSLVRYQYVGAASPL